MNKLKIIFIVLISFQITLSVKAQEKQNNISISGGAGLSNKSYYDIVPKEIKKSGNGLFSLLSIQYGREINQFEISLTFSDNQYSDIIKNEADSFFIGDTTLYVGMKEKETASLLYFQLAPELKYRFKISEKISFHTGFSLGINHIYREKSHVVSSFEAHFKNVDTTYINPNLSYFKKFVMSGKLFFGLSYKLCDSFSIGTDIYYESFLGKFTKPAYTNEYWVRLYNYGLNLGVKYHF